MYANKLFVVARWKKLNFGILILRTRLAHLWMFPTNTRNEKCGSVRRLIEHNQIGWNKLFEILKEGENEENPASTYAPLSLRFNKMNSIEKTQ